MELLRQEQQALETLIAESDKKPLLDWRIPFVKIRPVREPLRSLPRPDRSQYQTLTPINYRIQTSASKSQPKRLKTLPQDHSKKIRLSMDKTFKWPDLRARRRSVERRRGSKCEQQIRRMLQESGWLMVKKAR